MQNTLRELLERRRNKAIAVILGTKERECDKHLPMEASMKLRKAVLDQLNEFHDFVADVLDSLDNGDVVLNDHYMQKLDEVHAAVVLSSSSNGNGRY